MKKKTASTGRRLVGLFWVSAMLAMLFPSGIFASESNTPEAVQTEESDATTFAEKGAEQGITSEGQTYDLSITFAPNGADAGQAVYTQTIRNISYAGTAEDGLTANRFTRTGYIFVGWKADGETSDFRYADGSRITLTSTNPDLRFSGGDKTVSLRLLAQWRPNAGAVVYHSNDGKNETTREAVWTYGESLTLGRDVSGADLGFSRAGYSGCVWSTAADPDTKGAHWYERDQKVQASELFQTNGKPVTEDGDRVDLYAQWIDTEAPTIAYQATLLCDERGKQVEKTEKDGIDFAKDGVTYQIRITEEGTGLDPDNVFYTVSTEADTVGTVLNEQNAVKAEAVTEETGDGQNVCVFMIRGPARGTLYVQAQDQAMRPEYAAGDGQTLLGLTAAPNRSPVTAIHLLTIEADKPALTLKDDQKENMWAGAHTIVWSADDSRDSSGKQLTIASGIREVSWSLTYGGRAVEEYQNRILFSVENAAYPKTPGEIRNYESTSGTIHLDKHLPDGIYTVSVTATDFCGNMSQKSLDQIRVDNGAPMAAVEMKTNPKEPGFFRADNDAFAVTLSDDASGISEYLVTVSGPAETYTVRNGGVTTAGDAGRVSGIDIHAAGGKVNNRIEILFRAETVANCVPEGQSGTVSVTVTAADQVGNANKAVRESEAAGGRLASVSEAGSAASFILDRENPTVTKIASENLGNLYGTEYYTKAVSVTTTYTVSETNWDDKNYSFGYTLENGAEAGVVRITDRRAVISFQKEGRYSGISLSGADRAGNPLVLEKDVREARSGDAEQHTNGTGNERKGTVSLNHARIIDRTAPEAVITYTSLAKAYLCQDANRGAVAAAYYNREITANIRITDQYGSTAAALDQSRLYTGRNTKKGTQLGAGSAGVREISRKYKVGRTDPDGVYFYTVYGTDRAGNALKVTECTPADSETCGNHIRRFYETKGAEAGYEAKYHLVLDTVPPETTITAPEPTIKAVTAVTRRTADGRDLFNRAVSLQFAVTDPNANTRGSGLKSVTYSVSVDGRTVTDSATLYTNDAVSRTTGTDAPIDYTFTRTITIPAANPYETNDIEVELNAEDKSGNRSDPRPGSIYRFGIDTIGPEITVTYDNNSAQNGKYFKKDRTATIRVADRNVDSDGIHIHTEVDVPGSFRYSAAGPADGDGDIWTKTLRYSTDGDYTLNIAGTDALGNPASVTYEGVAPRAFVIDETAPVIHISFDNNDVRNGRYYKQDRTATVTILEHNFDGSAAAAVTASNPRNPQPSVPKMSAFRSSGDTRTASIAFTEEGAYTIRVTYTDMAGNEAEPYTVSEFVIDKTKPTIKVLNDSIRSRAYNGDIHPEFGIEDTCYARSGVSWRLAGKKSVNGRTLSVDIPTGQFGGTVSLGGFKKVRDYDDLYELELIVTDLAGNTNTCSVHFSVNRYGSNFYYGDISTERLTNQIHYVTEGRQYVIGEQNVNRVPQRTILIYRDQESTALKEGTDYKVTERETSLGYEYLYTLNRENFDAEGSYTIIVQSKDEAGNLNTNSSVKADDQTTSVEYRFAVDKTKPEVAMTGRDISRHIINANSIDVELDISENMAVSRVVIEQGILSGGEYEVQKTETCEGKALTEYIEKNGPKFPVTVEGQGAKTVFVRAAAYDGAGNVSDQCRWSGVISASRMDQFYANKPVFWGAAAVATASLLLAVLLVRRQKERTR